MLAKTLRLENLVIFLIAIACVIASTQFLSLDVTRYAKKSEYFPSKSAVSSVNRSFYQAFSLGSWRYQGAQAKSGGVNAYIQIPEKLDMELDIQHQYLRRVICPNSNNLDLWHELRNTKLLVHIYTTNKQKTVSAMCENPLSA